MTKEPTAPGAKLHDGFVLDGEIVQIPGVECVSYVRNPRYAAKKGRHFAIRKDKPRFAVCHNESGRRPVVVKPGKGPRGRAHKLTVYLANTLRYAGVHFNVDLDGYVICMQDLARCSAYGAGQKEANRYGIQFEICVQRTNEGTVVYDCQIDVLAKIVDWLATYFGWEKKCCTLEKFSLVEALATSCFDHFQVSRARGIGDTMRLVSLRLIRDYGWKASS